jgi:hypothetical protein
MLFGRGPAGNPGSGGASPYLRRACDNLPLILALSVDDPDVFHRSSTIVSKKLELDAVLRWESPGLDGALERLVVGFRLVCIGTREARKCPVGGIALAKIAG